MKQNKMHRKRNYENKVLMHWLHFNVELRLRNGENVGYYAKCNCYKPWKYIYMKMKLTETGSRDIGRKWVCVHVRMCMLSSYLSLWWEDSINITYIVRLRKLYLDILLLTINVTNRLLFVCLFVLWSKSLPTYQKEIRTTEWIKEACIQKLNKENLKGHKNKKLI